MLSKVDEAMCLIGRWTITSEQCEDATRLMNASLEQGRVEGAEQMADKVRSHGGHYTQKGDTVLSEYITPRATVRAETNLFIVPASILEKKGGKL